MSDFELSLLLLAVVTVCLALVGLGSPRRRRAWRQGGSGRGPRLVPTAGEDVATEQLRKVMGASFASRRLLNVGEARVFYQVRDAVRNQNPNWHVMAQVSLGEVLSTADREAYAAINSKRVDLLLVTNRGDAVAAIEYQGEGHHQGSAAARDAVKKEALRKAGVAYIEVMPGHSSDDVAREIACVSKAWKTQA